MLTIATIVPNDYFAPWPFVRSIFKLPPKYRFKQHQGALCSVNRNYIWREMILERQDGFNDDLLFVDSDIVFEPEDVATIEKDLESYDVIAGIYLQKAWDWKACIFKKKFNSDDYDFTDVKEGIFEIEACGAGFLGISKRVIGDQRMSNAPFDYIRKRDLTHGEDVSFCERVRELGYKIYCDSSIKVGHIKYTIYTLEDKEPDIY